MVYVIINLSVFRGIILYFPGNSELSEISDLELNPFGPLSEHFIPFPTNRLGDSKFKIFWGRRHPSHIIPVVVLSLLPK